MIYSVSACSDACVRAVGPMFSCDSICGEISDNGLEQGNWRFWATKREEVATKLWDRASTYRVEEGLAKDTLVETIKVLENRYKLCSSKNVGYKGVEP